MQRSTFGFWCAVAVLVSAPATAQTKLPGCVNIAVRATGEADVVAKPPTATADQGAIDYWHAMPGGSWFRYRIAAAGAMSIWSCPVIAVRSTGEALVVDRDARNNLVYYRATPGSAWTPQQIDGGGTNCSGNAGIAVRATNEIDIVTVRPNCQVMYYWQIPPSQSFSSTAIAGSGATVGLGSNSIAVRSNGEADVAILSQNGGLLYYFAFPGGPWNGPTTIAPASAVMNNNYPAIGVSPSSKAWVAVRNSNGGLTGYRATPGSVWSPEVISSRLSNNPSIAVRSTGEVDVVASGNSGGVYYYWQTQSGGNWSSAQLAGSGNFSTPAIAVRSNGEADVVAISYPYDVTYWHAMPGQPWSALTTLPK
jgi:hypothetical protein